MTFGLFLRIVGLLVASSYAAWGLENVSLHPVVRRGVQVSLCGFAVLYAFRLLGVVAV